MALLFHKILMLNSSDSRLGVLAKADDPTYGYGDNTPEYLLVEGADNGAAGANFKQALGFVPNLDL